MRRLLHCGAVALLVGCTDTGGLPTDQNPGNHAIRPSTAAEVIRTNVGFAFGADLNSQLAVVAGFDVGVTPADLCAENFDISDNSIAHIVLTPSGGFHESATSREEEVPVLVFEFAGGLSSYCDLVGAPLIASGTVKYTFSAQLPSSGILAFSWTVHGIVDLESGGQARLFGSTRAVILPDGSVLFDESRVRLTPL